jgi:hypothetical protein
MNIKMLRHRRGTTLDGKLIVFRMGDILRIHKDVTPGTADLYVRKGWAEPVKPKRSAADTKALHAAPENKAMRPPANKSRKSKRGRK